MPMSMCKPSTPKFDDGHAADLSVTNKKRRRPWLLSISIVALSIVIGVILNSLSTFEGGPHDGARPIPPEAVPIWQTTELHWFVRYFMGYLWGALAPVATMTACPTVIDRSNTVEVEAAQTCMKRGRAMEDVDMVDLESMFDVEDIFIDRPNNDNAGGDPLRVTLLKKQKQNNSADSTEDENRKSSKAKIISPLILFIHGGGFVVRGVKKTMSAQIFNELLKLDSNNYKNDQLMEDATFAVVEYRLAPEHIYPAATNDCVLALNHLVHKMKLGKGGVHVAGSSAGATLTMETTLTNLDIVDTFYVDEPVVAFPRTKNSDDKRKVEWTMDSASVRRYAYTRMPPVAWLEWALKAYTGKTTESGVEDNLPLGTVSTNVDITGGAMTVSEWTKKRKKNKKRGLPRLILVTAMGDPLLDGGLSFKKVYDDALIKEKEEVKDSLGVLKAKHFDTYSGHASFYLFESQLFQRIIKEWYGDITDVWRSKSE